MSNPKRIALLMLGVSSDKCGGAERFFADFFEKYQTIGNHELYFFLDPGTKDVLEKIGRLNQLKNVVVLKNVSNRFKKFIETRNFRNALRKFNIDIVHVSNYGTYYFDRLEFMRRQLPEVKLVINIVDCEIPHILPSSQHPRSQGYKNRYLPLFRALKPDAYYSWYELFGQVMNQQNYIPNEIPVVAVQSRFSDTKGFAPAEDKTLSFVYAARFTEQKQPVMFVDAVGYLKENGIVNSSAWKFHMFGNGDQETLVKSRIKELGLDAIIQVHSTSDLRPVFAKSTCFVSTQDYENFPSLSMNEAMAAGNVIVARNVGQTNLFVKDGVNGYLATSDNAKGVAEAMMKVIQYPEKNAAMMKESIRLATEVHTPENFIRQIDLFWNSLK
jgi:glycosyltransferase involved in cell wall biosynthesis